MMRAETLRTQPVPGFDPDAEKRRAMEWYRQQGRPAALGSAAVETAEDEDAWREAAACRGADPELFFPINAVTKEGKEQTAEAKAVCAGCRVKEPCEKEYPKEKYGVRVASRSERLAKSKKSRAQKPQPETSDNPK